jgi:parvulin-like peptidyl-prolyl isomerase
VVVALLTAGAITATAQDPSQEVALIVNGEKIFTWEIALLMPAVQTEMASQGLDTKGEGVIQAVLGRAIDSKLLAQEARRRGIEPDNGRIDQKMNKMAKGSGGRANLEAELIKSGITFAQLRSTVVQADLVQTLVETEVGAGIGVTEEEVAAFYAANPELFKGQDKIHTRHILFMVGAGEPAAQKKIAWDKAVAAHERVVAGEDFATLAAVLSEGPNAQQGGDLGFTARGQMVESFDEAVWILEVGEISEVVESHLGYHVIKVEEIMIGPTVPLEEAQPLVEDLLRQQRIGEALSELVAKLRAAADIGDPEF